MCDKSNLHISVSDAEGVKLNALLFKLLCCWSVKDVISNKKILPTL